MPQMRMEPSLEPVAILFNREMLVTTDSSVTRDVIAPVCPLRMMGREDTEREDEEEEEIALLLEDRSNLSSRDVEGEDGEAPLPLPSVPPVDQTRASASSAALTMRLSFRTARQRTTFEWDRNVASR